MFIRIEDSIFEYSSLNGRAITAFIDDENYSVKQSIDVSELCDVCETYWAEGTYEYLDLKHEQVPVKAFVKDLATNGLLSVKVGIRTKHGITYIAELTANGVWVTLK